MKCQILFSGKNKKNNIILSSAENAQRVVKVKGRFRGSVPVFNAASRNRTALLMFQEHIWRHTYLRYSISNMVPDLKVGIY